MRMINFVLHKVSLSAIRFKNVSGAMAIEDSDFQSAGRTIII